jgi:hypothetical protein
MQFHGSLERSSEEMYHTLCIVVAITFERRKFTFGIKNANFLTGRRDGSPSYAEIIFGADSAAYDWAK